MSYRHCHGLLRVRWTPIILTLWCYCLAAASLSAEPGMVEVSPVSAGFREAAQQAFTNIPDPVRLKLSEAGWQVQLAGFVVDAAPWLAKSQPRGWPQGWTWKQVDAAHLPDQRRLILAEKRWTSRGHVVLNNRVTGVLRHELGHAFDFAAGVSPLPLSSSREFRSLYERDLAAIDPDLQGVLGYYLQTGAAGRQEAFAEAFAILLGGGSDTQRDATFRRSFPAVMAWLEQQVEPAANPVTASLTR